MLYGVRNKIFAGLDAVISIGGAFSWSEYKGNYIFSSALNFGIGISPFSFSPGFNKGRVEKYK